MHPFYHAQSSARKHGGQPEDYLSIHQWFDESKSMMADFRHRALRHHAEGIFLAERIFGTTITNSAARQVPVRFIGEQHVKEDLGWIPSMQDWFRCIRPAPWMGKAGQSEAPATEDQDECHQLLVEKLARGESCSLPGLQPTDVE